MQQEKHIVKVAVEPANWRRDVLSKAIQAAGAQLTDASEASALVWVDADCGKIADSLHDGIDWVQLPWAGIEPFRPVLDHKRRWTCGKGIYAEPVAEHVLALILACLHNLPNYAKAQSWAPPVGKNLKGSKVLVLGGGGISEKLLPLLAACGAHTVVLRRTPQPLEHTIRCAGLEQLHDELQQADIVVLALALTEETKGVIAAEQLALMKNTAWIVNVARGAHIVTEDLVDALRSETIAGAALDVTNPEPLPEGHALWQLENCLITPHVGNTPEMGIALLKAHIEENVRRYINGEELLGPVNVDAGY
ncbi:MAG: D-isomer specific 2-hydroxyacid dehydrogenase family protein [Pseudomonadales bacterium]